MGALLVITQIWKHSQDASGGEGIGRHRTQTPAPYSAVRENDVCNTATLSEKARRKRVRASGFRLYTTLEDAD